MNVAIRLDARKHRQLRQCVLKRGTSIQRVVEDLIGRWIDESGDDAPADLRGFLRDSDVLELRQRERQAELSKDQDRG
ncbi:MAG: hypothetical protein LAQ69_04365 [Acidobacteriia bacterium]|nr:hypothetical protein [Terriglobia bacterium]